MISRFLLIFIIASFMLACGGGTVGTGIGGGNSKTVSGKILLDEDTPLTQAQVVIVQTGESDITDAEGNFSIETEFEGDDFDIQISKDDIDTTVSVEDVDDETNNIQLEISLETQEMIGSIKRLDVWARIVGKCDIFFENTPRIRQSGSVNNTDCTLKFFASGDGMRLARVPGIIEFSNCRGKNWTRIASGTTGVGAGAGVGQINFRFIDDKEHCLYRFSAPADILGVTPVHVFIDTFTFQSFQDSRR